MKTLGIIIVLILTGVAAFAAIIEMRSRHLKKIIKLGHTGMRCRYWCGEEKYHGIIEKYEGNGYVRIQDELASIHIDNIEPALI